jgi:hypothetical protein
VAFVVLLAVSPLLLLLLCRPGGPLLPLLPVRAAAVGVHRVCAESYDAASAAAAAKAIAGGHLQAAAPPSISASGGGGGGGLGCLYGRALLLGYAAAADAAGLIHRCHIFIQLLWCVVIERVCMRLSTG